MEAGISRLLEFFEAGRITRRELIGRMVALAGASAGIVGAPRAGASEEGHEPVFEAKGLNHVALRVTDIERSADFYGRVLGMPVLRKGSYNAFLGCGDDFVALFRSSQGGLDHLAFTIDGYRQDRAVAALEAAGLESETAEDRTYFRDPDGIQLQLSPEDEWPGGR